MTFAEKVWLGVKLRVRLARFRLRRRTQLRALLSSAPWVTAKCPICRSTEVKEFAFTRPDEIVKKRFCTGCEHMFSEFLQTGRAESEIVFEIDRENPGRPTQVELLEEVTLLSGLSSGSFLDFGVGGNVSAFQEAASRFPQHRFMGCDVYPASVDGYFNTYGADAPFGIFDGIASYAVIEHLTNTIDAWRTMNRLLKPMTGGGGVMVHSFPSQWHLDFDDWSIQIATHSCLFSRQSLSATCAQTGFRILRADPPRLAGPHYHPVMTFRKVRDVA